MKNYWVNFQVIGCEDKSLVGYKEITCHLIFDVKINLTQKVRCMTGGHLTNLPSSVKYASNISQEIIRISFLVASSNELGILAGDTQNALIHAENKEKHSHNIIFFQWKTKLINLMKRGARFSLFDLYLLVSDEDDTPRYRTAGAFSE